MGKLITKVPNVTVSVKRDGKKVRALPGVAFDFTEEEITQVEGMLPGCLRDPQNESAQVAETGKDDKGGKAGKAGKDGKSDDNTGTQGGDVTGAGGNTGTTESL